jgi:hypothetical protein
MLSKLFWFALGAGFMRYMMNRQGVTGGAGMGLGSLSGSSAGSGASTGRGRGLQQSLRDRTGGGAMGAGTGAATGGAMLPDDGHDDSLMPASSGTGTQGSDEQTGEEGYRQAPSPAMSEPFRGA